MTAIDPSSAAGSAASSATRFTDTEPAKNLSATSVTHTSAPTTPPTDAPNQPTASELANGGLTHFDASGQAHMVDVGGKAETHRVAVATGTIRMKPETLAMIQSGTAKKGDVLGVSRIAAIMATKRASELIPLCHPLTLTRVAVTFEPQTAVSAVCCRVEVETFGKTGIEIEALFAAQVGLLTIYDMCKSVDRGMTIDAVRVVHKSGGASGNWNTSFISY